MRNKMEEEYINRYLFKQIELDLGLISALKDNNITVTEMLLKAGANPDRIGHRERKGYRIFIPLYEACRNRNLVIVQLLLEYNAVVDQEIFDNAVAILADNDSGTEEDSMNDIITLLLRNKLAKSQHAESQDADN